MDERSSLLYLIEFATIAPEADDGDEFWMSAARRRLTAGSPVPEVLTENAVRTLRRLAPERYGQLAARHHWPRG